MYAIWCNDEGDWLREMPSKVDDGGVALLAFFRAADARERAAKHYGYDTYAEVKRAGFCVVRRMG